MLRRDSLWFHLDAVEEDNIPGLLNTKGRRVITWVRGGWGAGGGREG